jgi:hypothetical protein
MPSARYDQYEPPDFRSRLEWLGMVSVSILSVVLAILFTKTFPDFDDKFIWISVLLLYLGICYLLLKRKIKRDARLQARRDEAALKLFNAARSGEVEKFAVFLRPFYTTNKIVQNEYVKRLVTEGGQTRIEQDTFTHPLEETIVGALRYMMQVVALGKPGETTGVGRILVDDTNWQSAASELMSRASLVICVPSSRPGTHWELNEIIETHYLRKTVFVMPSAQSGGMSSDIRHDWVLLSQQMAAYGIAIPQYDNDGLLFSINAKGQCTTEKLCLNSESSGRDLMEAFTRLSNSAQAVDESETTIAKRAISVPICHAPIPISQSWIKQLTQSWSAAARH